MAKDLKDYPFKAECCGCKAILHFSLSPAMQLGLNTGHLTCPHCKTFMHVEIAEGDRAATEPWGEYVQRETYGVAQPMQLTDVSEHRL